jgi:hypothetical protein
VIVSMRSIRLERSAALKSICATELLGSGDNNGWSKSPRGP